VHSIETTATPCLTALTLPLAGRHDKATLAGQVKTLSYSLLVLVLILAVTTPTSAAPPALIEIQVDGETWQGKVFAQGTQSFWLQSQDGRLRSFPVDGVRNFRKISPQFSGWTASIVRDKLRHELGKGFEFAGTRHYVVGAPNSQKARAYAETFEELYRTFQMYFSVRGFTIAEPDFPLIAIVFPDFESFARYARAEEVNASRSLLGYYKPQSNRIALYESADYPTQQSSLSPLSDESGGWIDGEAWATFQGSLKDTMIHEATHQAAFNVGLHSRIGPSPRWVVEGLATVFEAPGIRNSGGSGPARTRINHGRYLRFGDYCKSRRKPKSLEAFLTDDEIFQSSVFDAYAEAWALSFFLIKTRPRAYCEYLRTIAARDPMRVYPPADRLADFKNTISKELPLLEAEFLRFIAAIK